MGEGGEERSTKVRNFSGSHCGRLFVCKAYTHSQSVKFTRKASEGHG